MRWPARSWCVVLRCAPNQRHRWGPAHRHVPARRCRRPQPPGDGPTSSPRRDGGRCPRRCPRTGRGRLTPSERSFPASWRPRRSPLSTWVFQRPLSPWPLAPEALTLPPPPRPEQSVPGSAGRKFPRPGRVGQQDGKGPERRREGPRRPVRAHRGASSPLRGRFVLLAPLAFAHRQAAPR